MSINGVFWVKKSYLIESFSVKNVDEFSNVFEQG